MNCKYYCDRTIGWMLNNKIIVFLSLLCFCLFVSTLALSGQRSGLRNEVNELKEKLDALTSTTSTTVKSPDVTDTTTEVATTTSATVEPTTTATAPTTTSSPEKPPVEGDSKPNSNDIQHEGEESALLEKADTNKRADSILASDAELQQPDQFVIDSKLLEMIRS